MPLLIARKNWNKIIYPITGNEGITERHRDECGSTYSGEAKILKKVIILPTLFLYQSHVLEQAGGGKNNVHMMH